MLLSRFGTVVAHPDGEVSGSSPGHTKDLWYLMVLTAFNYFSIPIFCTVFFSLSATELSPNQRVIIVRVPSINIPVFFAQHRLERDERWQHLYMNCTYIVNKIIILLSLVLTNIKHKFQAKL